ncbi:MAG: hypothetical protein ACJA01_003012 [Saprospiraceae bacterium]|jgi:hypothetical protein
MRNKEYKWIIKLLSNVEADAKDVETLDIQKLIRLLRIHGLTWNVYSILNKKSSRNDFEEQIIQRLKLKYKKYVIECLAKSGELIEVLSCIQDQGITAIPYKGAVQSVLLFGDVSTRTYSDMDILIHLTDLETVCSLMVKRGYIFEKNISWWYKPFFKYISCEYNMDLYSQDGIRKFHLEPHWQVGIRRFQMNIKLSELSPLISKGKFFAKEFNMFSTEGLFVSTVLAHSNRENWQKLKDVYDIHAFLSLYGSAMDWKLIYAIASKSKFSNLITFAIYYSHELLRSPIPQYVQKHISKPRSIDKQIVKTILLNQRLGNGSAQRSSAMESILFHLKIRKGFSTKMKVIYHHVVRVFIKDVKKTYPDKVIPSKETPTIS